MKTTDDLINIKISKEALEGALELLKASMLPYSQHKKNEEVREALQQAIKNSSNKNTKAT